MKKIITKIKDFFAKPKVKKVCKFISGMLISAVHFIGGCLIYNKINELTKCNNYYMGSSRLFTTEWQNADRYIWETCGKNKYNEYCKYSNSIAGRDEDDDGDLIRDLCHTRDDNSVEKWRKTRA